MHPTRFVTIICDVASNADTDDPGSVQLVQEILSTSRRVEWDLAHEKLMHYMLQGSGADLEVTARALIIRYDWNPSRNRYTANAAAGIVSKLLEWCDACVVLEPRAFRFSGTRVPRSGLFWEWVEPSEAFDVWFLPGTVPRVMVRRARFDAEQPLADAPPHPLGFPYRTVTLEQPIPCPHCGHYSDSYRDVEQAWICGKCARSFPVGPVEY